MNMLTRHDGRKTDSMRTADRTFTINIFLKIRKHKNLYHYLLSTIQSSKCRQCHDLTTNRRKNALQYQCGIKNICMKQNTKQILFSAIIKFSDVNQQR